MKLITGRLSNDTHGKSHVWMQVTEAPLAHVSEVVHSMQPPPEKVRTVKERWNSCHCDFSVWESTTVETAEWNLEVAYLFSRSHLFIYLFLTSFTSTVSKNNNCLCWGFTDLVVTLRGWLLAEQWRHGRSGALCHRTNPSSSSLKAANQQPSLHLFCLHLTLKCGQCVEKIA